MNVQIDWDAVTAETGLKNNKTTRTRFGQIQKKLETAASPQKKRSRSKSPIDNGEAEQTPEVRASPPKRAKKGTRPSAPAAKDIRKTKASAGVKIKSEVKEDVEEDVESEPSEPDWKEYLRTEEEETEH
jgi:hypothetical protein